MRKHRKGPLVTGQKFNLESTKIIPYLTADEAILHYNNRHSDSEWAREVMSDLLRLVADISDKLDAVQLGRLLVAMREVAMFLGWKEGQS